jgi:hypothetical protein
MFVMIAVLVWTAGMFFIGCEPQPPETSVQKEQRLENFAVTELPTEAKKVMDLGNGWYTFELETKGRKRAFLFHRLGDFSGECSWGLECITELEP